MTEPAAVKTRRTPRPLDVDLGGAELRAICETMVLSRALDERMWLLNRQGRAHFTISCQGHEAAQVGTAAALRRGEDITLPYYRDLGVVLWMGMTPREVMLSFFARADDPNSGGRQMPNHWGHAGLRIISGSSPVGTQIPHAAGVALAAKIRHEPTVTAVYFGEGTTSEGDFHEGLNFAAIHRLPVIFVCENNGYAISVPRHKQMATATVAERAAAYGMPGIAVDGTDVLAVYRVMRRAVDRARSGQGPTLIDTRVHRFTPHSSDDDDRVYRPPEEVESARQQDPVEKFRRTLVQHDLLTTAQDHELRERVAAIVEDAVVFAEQSPLPAAADLTRHVFAESGRR
ncbi:MAG: thiamine pyrophosphate-dependent dehydrogenase E1 component subunit alpha [Chloroflexi bacterium]|nr:thiamine pyrophosphate-dependent dehydrogenase E1 component subunit alpha [Chloroflexota bacterium]